MKITLILILIFLTKFIYAEDKSKLTNNQIQTAVNDLSFLFGSIKNVTYWDLDSIDITDETSDSDRFSAALSHGDYNNDGWQDIAIGIPAYDYFNSAFFMEGQPFITINSGAVLILYGTSSGLSSTNHQYLLQSLTEIEGLEGNEFFGQSMASGDFNCDGITDLVVGTPNEDITFDGAKQANAGAINIFYGSLNGFEDLGQGSTFIHQGLGQSEFSVSSHDFFGFSLATGNFNRDSKNGHDCYDIAVSIPYEDFGDQINQIINAGEVDVYYGSSTGISLNNIEKLFQDGQFVDGESENFDLFGWSLASAPFKSASVYSDLAVGIPGEEVNGKSHAGAVQVFDGSNAGFTGGDNEIWSQAGDINGLVEANDRFGTSLTTGYFNNDFAADLVIGTPNEGVDGESNAGTINIIYGGIFGLNSINNQIFHQNVADINGVAESQDLFGAAVTSGNLNYDAYSDLIVAAPGENSQGAFHILYGSTSGVTVNSDLVWERFGNDGDEMGLAMTVADFGNGPELAVSIPGADSFDGDNDAGLLSVFEFSNPDVIFKNSFETPFKGPP